MLNKKILFIVGGVLLIILVGVVLFLRSGKLGTAPTTTSTPQQTDQNQVNPDTTVQSPGSIETPVVTAPPVDPKELEVKQLATLFVERFGSYSNQNNQQNYKDVVPLMTASMANWAASQNATTSLNYYGVTTNVVAASLKESTDTTATVEVGVQEVIETQNEQKIEYRTGQVQMVKEGNTWKVSGLYWAQ